VTNQHEGVLHRLRRAGKAVVRALRSTGPAFPERVQHHLVAFEIEEDDGIEEVLAIRSHGSVYNFSNYVAQDKRTVSLPTERGHRVITSSRIVGVTVVDSWKGTPSERTFDIHNDVFERHGWTERTTYPGTESD